MKYYSDYAIFCFLGENSESNPVSLETYLKFFEVHEILWRKGYSSVLLDWC